MAIRHTMDNDFYDKYAKPLLERGYLTLEEKTELGTRMRKHVENTSNQRFEDVINTIKQAEQEKAAGKGGPATDDLARIQRDAAYREKAVDGLNDDDRQVAMNLIRQGHMQPEDKIRARLNHWGGSDDIMSVLKELKPSEIQQVKEHYAQKYGRELTADLTD